MSCTVCYQLLQASSSGFCLPQTTFLHPLCGSFRRPGKKCKRLTSTPRASYACVVASMCTSARCICSNRAFPVSRTLETLLAVFWEAFSLFARRSQVVDFPLHQRASICSSCLTTARRASSATSYATPSVWTRASSSPNSVASGQSFAGGVVLGSLKQARGSAYLDRSLSHQRSTTKDLQTLLLSLLKTGWAPAQLKSTPSHRSGGSCFCSTIQFLASPFATPSVQHVMYLTWWNTDIQWPDLCFSGLTESFSDLTLPF